MSTAWLFSLAGFPIWIDLEEFFLYKVKDRIHFSLPLYLSEGPAMEKPLKMCLSPL